MYRPTKVITMNSTVLITGSHRTNKSNNEGTLTVIGSPFKDWIMKLLTTRPKRAYQIDYQIILAIVQNCRVYLYIYL